MIEIMVRIIKPIINALIFISVFGAACTSSANQTSIATDTSTVATAQQNTPLIATMVPRFFPTQTPVPSPIWGTVQCSNGGVPIHPPSEFGFEGSVIYWDPVEWKYFLMGGKPLERYAFDISDEYSVIGFSNSGSLLAFRADSTNSLEIFDIAGNRWQVMPVVDGLGLNVDETIEKYSFEYVTWLGDSALFVQVYPIGGGEQHRPYPAILDVRSGDWIDIGLSDLPNRGPTWAAIPSPNLDYIAYIDAHPDNPSGLSIWSVQGGSKIWVDEDYDDSLYFTKGHGVLYYALWSPTSDFFAYKSEKRSQSDNDPGTWDRGVYLLSIKVNLEEKITNLTDFYPRFSSHLLGWSPDGRYLAFDADYGFIGQSSSLRQLQLLVYDTFDHGYAYSCQIADPESVSQLLWSQSSDAFIFVISCDNMDCPKSLRYGETDSEILYTLIEGIGHIGQGWSPFPPSSFLQH